MKHRSANESVHSVSQPRATFLQWLTKRLPIFSWLFAVGPALLVLTLLTHALHVHAVLGRWPIVYRDSPASLLLTIHEFGVVMPALYLTLLSLPGWLVFGVIPCAFHLGPCRLYLTPDAMDRPMGPNHDRLMAPGDDRHNGTRAGSA
jgi:hypothetical protein